MMRTVGIGNQDFETIRKEGYFYVDKTNFIREWWQSGDNVTLITRPRRFGKTLNMSMVEEFFPLNMPEDASCLKGFHMERRKIPQDSGSLAGDFSQLCECERNHLF